jgi:hypothetical protein
MLYFHFSETSGQPTTALRRRGDVRYPGASFNAYTGCSYRHRGERIYAGAAVYVHDHSVDGVRPSEKLEFFYCEDRYSAACRAIGYTYHRNFYAYGTHSC